VLHARDDVLARGEPDDALRGIGGRAPFVVQLTNGGHYGTDGITAITVDDDAIAGAERCIAWEIGEEEGLGAADRR
jgi:hypothetical protein